MFIAGNGGFSLDGIPAKDLGIIMGRESERPITPATSDRFLSIPGKNGILDFGADMGARYLNLQCNVITKDYRSLQQATEHIASTLLDGYGRPKTMKLVFDVNPDRYYLVRYSGSLSIDRLFGFGNFTLPLVTVGEPYARSITDSDNIILDSDILLDSDIRLDDDWSYSVTEATIVEIHNWGKMIVKPIVKVTGSFSTLSITANGKTFNYNSPISSDTLTINCERMTIKKGTTNGLKGMSGNFIELQSGINEVQISGASLNCDVSFIFSAMYL